MTEELQVDKDARDPENALWVALRPEPVSLSSAEVQSGGQLKPAPTTDGIAARAWVHFATRDGLRAARVQCRVTAYNSKVCRISGNIKGLPFTAHVWANAVTRSP
ncbi:hypothetical protein [Gryllotalpicola koreensis]|uniref:Uncharacterized protein n=1 Tax=Gryllotalpicola koreensis TaxID=993086 RepID=A0ABP8A1K8_9MICO